MFSLNIPHFSSYALTIEEKTVLKYLVEQKKITPLNEKKVNKQFNILMEMAKENGFEIYGQDVGKELTEWTSNKLGAKIWNQEIGKLNTEIKFDVITLFDVIEHVESPLQFLSECKKLLAEDGIIVIFTPNFDSLAFHIMKEDSNLVSFPEHLVYFSEKPVEVLSNKMGMKLIHYKTCGLDLGDLKSYYEWLGEDEIAQTYSKLYPLIQPLVDASGAGNHIRFILKNK